MFETGIVDVYIMTGPEGKDVVRQQTFLTGGAPLQPLNVLGFHQCKWNYKTSEEVIVCIIINLIIDSIMRSDCCYPCTDFKMSNREKTDLLN